MRPRLRRAPAPHHSAPAGGRSGGEASATSTSIARLPLMTPSVSSPAAPRSVAGGDRLLAVLGPDSIHLVLNLLRLACQKDHRRRRRAGWAAALQTAAARQIDLVVPRRVAQDA